MRVTRGSEDGVVWWGLFDVLSQFGRVAPCARSCARAAVTSVLASLLLVAAGRSVHDASATGDTRTLSFHHTHSGEDLTVTFKRNGRYDEAALKELNHYLRDWRSEEQTAMDRHLFDILWEVYRDVDGKQPIQIISSYRSPGTNAMLRRRSAHSGVARHSQHMLGHAMDFYIPGVRLEEIRFAGLRLQRGGVGFYPTSGSPFVHLDTGNVRHWPRMTREQLVRVFPNGRTVHIPSDGNPLPGYELALAELERRKTNEDGTASDKPSLLASLLRGKSSAADDDDEGAPAAAAAPTPVKPSTAIAMAESLDAPALVPLPRAKPVAAFQVASSEAPPASAAPLSVLAPAPRPAMAAAQPAPAPTAAPTAGGAAPQTPADVVNARGFWGNGDAGPRQATPEQIAALAARNAFASADPPSTASVPRESTTRGHAQLPGAIDRSKIVTAGMPAPQGLKVSALARDAVNVAAASLAAKTRHDAAGVATATRIAPANNANSVWMRAMILAPRTSQVAMLATSLNDQDMTVMRALFVKPAATVAMSFTDDPLMGLSSDRFAGPAIAPVAKTTFALQTASLQ